MTREADAGLLHQPLTSEDLMGLLDQLAGQVMGSLGGQNQDPVPQGKLFGGVLGMIGRFGGLPALLQRRTKLIMRGSPTGAETLRSINVLVLV